MGFFHLKGSGDLIRINPVKDGITFFVVDLHPGRMTNSLHNGNLIPEFSGKRLFGIIPKNRMRKKKITIQKREATLV